MTITEEQLNQLFYEIKEEIKDIVPFSERTLRKVKINNKKRALGSCRTDFYKNYFQIELSKYLLECDEKLVKETLIHELIHTCSGCYNHGVNFKKYAELVKRQKGYNIVVKSEDEQFGEKAKQDKYKITCLKCGNVFYRDRLPKCRQVLRHAQCGGVLKIEVLR